MIKDIVASVSADRDGAADYALSVAEAFGAHLAVVGFAYDPMVHPPVCSTIVSGILEAARAESENAAKASIARIDEAARKRDVSVETRLVTTLADAGEKFARFARRFDMSIVGQPAPDTVAPQDLIIEAALFHSGRPAIVVPYVHKAGLELDRVMICWDGGSTAARAIADAMPFLTRARTVEIVIVAREPAPHHELPGADMAQHLARHGVTVAVSRIPAVDRDIAATILSHAADTSANLIVMGGYGHSRLREFVLGGATRGVLTAMTVPTLMSH